MRKKEFDQRVLIIDLSSKTVEKKTIESSVEKDFLGGFGVGVKLAYDLITPKTDPFDPRNPIIISAGVLGGSRASGSPRLSAITKYPLTGAIAMGNGAMRFSQELKASGFEHVIILGKAKSPTIIKISDDRVDFLDAHDLWGKDLYETTDSLWERFGKKWSVIAIGQAGENLVKISVALIDKISHIGKGGLPAVMGSKNLKAIIANGSRAISISDPVRFKKVVNRIYQHVKAIPDRDEIINLGNMKGWNKWWEEGIPMKANTEMFPKWKATELYGPKIYLDKVKKGRASCPSCPLPDKEIMEVKEGEFKDLITFAGSFSGRVYNYGIRCGVGTYDRVIKIHDVANRLGICDHAFSSLYDFAVEVFDKGRITLKDTEGIVLKRDFETTLKVMELTAFRKGFGNILADGYHCFFERFGEDLKTEAIQAKGMDMLHEPRLGGLTPKAFIMVVNPRGGHHQPGLGTPSDSHSKNIDDFRVWCEKAGVPPDAMERIFFHPMKMNIARLAKHAQEFYTILSCLGICARGPIPRLYSLDDCAELYSSFKGIEISPVEMKKAGERVWNLYKMINVREGFERKDDLFPEKWLTPIKGEMGEKILMDYFETKNLTREDLQNLLDDYYDECGWDKIRGIPTEEKLKDLGLTQAIGDLRE